MLASSLNATLSIFGLIFSGYIFSSANIMRRGAGEVFSDYVFYIALPVEIFLTTSRANDIAGAGLGGYIQAYGVGIAVLWMLIFVVYRLVLKKDVVEIGLNLIAIGQTNTAFLAAPIFILVLGDAALVIPIIIFQSVVLTSLSVFVMEVPCFSKNKSVSGFLKKSLFIIIKNPLILSALIGFLISRFNFSHAVDAGFFIIEGMDMIAKTAAPIALIALGASFYSGREQLALQCDRNEVVLGVLIKNVIHPAISFVVGKYLFGLPDLTLFALVLISAMPSPKNTFIFAQIYGLSVQKFNLILVATTGASFFVVNVACYFFLPSVA